MADLTEQQAALAAKITGSDSTGVETNYVNADANGNLLVKSYSAGTVVPGAVAAVSDLIGGQYNATLPTLTDGQQASVQVDSSGRILVSDSAKYDFSNTNLASAATYTTAWFDSATQGRGFNLSTISDQPLTYKIQHSPDQTIIKNGQSGQMETNTSFNTTCKAEARYFRVIYTNIGAVTTTTLFLSTIQTQQAEFGSTRLSDVNGTTLNITSGRASVVPPPGTIFVDVFDTAGLDTQKWTLTKPGSMTQTQSGGLCTLTGNTVASDNIALVSAALYQPVLSDNILAFFIKTEASIVTNCHRFWGLGSIPGSWTATTPLQNAVGYEIDTSGNLSAVVYSLGTKVFSFNLNNYKPGLQFTENLFYMEIRANQFNFFVNNVSIPVTQVSGTLLDSLLLPIRIHMINNTTPPASAASLLIGAAALGDENPANATILSDGIYSWRKATIKPLGLPALSTDNQLLVSAIPAPGVTSTYSASIRGLVLASSATDIFTITGSATKTIRINKMSVSGTQSNQNMIDIILLKRSTANSAGTSTAPTIVPHDSNNPAATATVLAYTANPTLGTLVGNLKAKKFFIPSTTPSGSAGVGSQAVLDFYLGTGSSQSVVLRGTAQVLAINMAATTLAGSSFDVDLEWTEE